MIVKVQISLASSDGVRRILIYNRDRSAMYEGPATPDLIKAMGGEPKKYFKARIVKKKFHLDQELEGLPSW